MKNGKSGASGETIFLLIAGLLMGTVFVFGMRYWNAPVKTEDAIHTTAIFSSYDERFGKGHHTKGIDVFFDDCQQLSIDGACVNHELRSKLDHISSGTKVDLIIHPNANTILDMRNGDTVVLDFNDTSEKLSNEKDGFLALGLLCYAAATYALIRLIAQS